MPQVSDDRPRSRQYQLLAKLRPRMAAPNKSECGHTRCRGRSDASRGILDHDAVGCLNPHPGRCVQE
jgi:hypothetical protein